MVLEMIIKICKFKKFCRKDESKICFSAIAFFIFSYLQTLLKNGIYTHLTDFNCRHKSEKNSPTGSGNIGARKLENMKKSRSTRSHNLSNWKELHGKI